MHKMKPKQWLVALVVATPLGLVLLSQPGQPLDVPRINGVAMVTGRILNVPGYIVGQPLPMTENMAAGETNSSAA